MRLRTRLPRASTNASVAASTPAEELHVECDPQPATISQQQSLQILQQLESFDTERVFTGQLTADGRLSAEGPQVTHNLRCVARDGILPSTLILTCPSRPGNSNGYFDMPCASLL